MNDDDESGRTRSLSRLPRRVLVWLVELYRTWISPTRMPSCRFEPSCSAYAVEALTTWGVFRGGALSLWRLAKCGPWHAPGYDPVPERHTPHVRDTARDTPSAVVRSEEQVTPC